MDLRRRIYEPYRNAILPLQRSLVVQFIRKEMAKGFKSLNQSILTGKAY